MSRTMAAIVHGALLLGSAGCDDESTAVTPADAVGSPANVESVSEGALAEQVDAVIETAPRR